jgi:hypothetical protein
LGATYLATALISADSVGITVRTENIETTFELAENHLAERYRHSDVIVQAIQRISNEFGD